MRPGSANVAKKCSVALMDWRKHWQGVPDFEQEDIPEYKKLIVHFDVEADYTEFAKLIGQNPTEKTKSIGHPKKNDGT